MDLRMTAEEREAFLADQHVGVMAVERDDGPPLSVPVWYDYEPGGEVVIIIGAASLKQKLLLAAGRLSLCAQQESLPYKYVTVEGNVDSDVVATVDDLRPMARRYLGEEMGDAYVAANNTGNSRTITFQPDRWFSVDYAKVS